MTTIIYDGTFEGWLTVVFEVFEYKFADVAITRRETQSPSIFGNHHNTYTDVQKAARVWRGLSQKLSSNALRQVYKSFLSELQGMDNTLLQYVQYVFSNSNNIEHNYAHPAVLSVTQAAKKVAREKHRMEAFVRFQLTQDKLYYAICQPDYNVLPLIHKHFKERYADQRWLIYDSRRKYGIYYNLATVETVKISFSEHTSNGKNIAAVLDEQEELYQQLWQQYFTSVNIVARKNMKLHIQHMPKRYWKYLPEKQVLEK
jgi:probable DNA metabolism protein